MTLPDLPDWVNSVSPVLTLADLTGGEQSVSNAGALGPYGVNTGEQLVIRLRPDLAGTSTRWAVRVIWNVAGVSVTVDNISLSSGGLYVFPYSGTIWRLPTRGDTFTVEAYTDGNSAVGITVWRDTQPLAAPAIYPGIATPGRKLADTSTLSLGPGASSTVYLAPVTSALAISWLPSASTLITATLKGINDNSGSLAADQLFIMQAATAGVNSGPIFAPGIGCELLITNNDAANRSPRLHIWDVS